MDHDNFDAIYPDQYERVNIQNILNHKDLID